MNKNQKNSLRIIIITSALLILSIFLNTCVKNRYLTALLFAIPYFTVSYRILYKSFLKIKKKDFMDENFLMSIASIGAFILGEYIESVAVLLFYTIGELFESIAVGKSRKSISDLMNINPEYANVQREESIIRVDPEEVKIGEIIVVKPGEKVPLDGIIIEGCSSVDTSALTGESVPAVVNNGDSIFSGSVNINGLIKIKITKEYSQSTVTKILELVETSVLNKSKSENFISVFAKYYTPIVVYLAIAIAFVPPLFFGSFSQWILKALVFLVVSCPCALVISVPLTFFAGIGSASKRGILIKGSSYIEKLSKAKTMIFDKTGTITKGKFEVTEINCNDENKDKLLEFAAKAEYYSSHPIAVSIKNAYKGHISTESIKNLNEIPGYGIEADIEGKKVVAGNAQLMKKYGIECNEVSDKTVVHISVDNFYLGNIVISDTIKEKSKESIKNLKKSGIRKTVMLTGDRSIIASNICETVGIDEFKSELLPTDKVTYTEQYIKHSDKPVVYVGDGINDAPVIARSDVGIAMGSIGSDSAIEAADIVIMDDRIEKIPLALSISKKTMKIVKQNIVFSIGVKVIVMLMSVFGFANMWVAIFADVGVSVIAIMNAIRAFSVPKYK